MKSTILVFIGVLLAGSAFSQSPVFHDVEDVFGRAGAVQGNVMKLTFPRSDLHVTVGAITVEPGLALTAWMAFEDLGGDGAMVMGDLVLLDSEIPAVEEEMVSQGLEFTAIHNHLIGETPVIKYMHVAGHGFLKELAQKVRSVLRRTAIPMTAPAPPAASQIDWSNVEAIIGFNGQHKGNLLLFGIPRNEKISERGMEVPAYMGMSTAINLQSVGTTAAATGDFVLLASEVNPVARALRQHGITVTALHSHMLEETPRLFFMHFWAVDTPEKIAEGLKAALDKTNSKMK